jgi:hypothetical protein
MRTYVRIPEYRYTATEYDLERPWIALGSSRGQVTLPDYGRFFEWARALAGATMGRPARSMATHAEVAAVTEQELGRVR